MPTSRIVVAGGSGFLGQNLAKALLSDHHEVMILSRQKPVHGTHIPWDGRTLGVWAEVLDDADALVNLCGRSVDCIKTPDHCDEIVRSRVESTRVLGEAMKRAKSPPKVWVQMSTAHIVGDPPSVVCNEDSPVGYGLAPHVGQAWETAFHAVAPENVRKVILRTSFVLARHGGAMTKLGLLARLGLGGTVGSGKQGMSWIHERDMNRLFMHAIKDERMQGVYMATAPNPVSNKEFMRYLRRAIGMPIGLPAFEWMVRIAAPLVMRTDPELALYGRYCVSKRLDVCGFSFELPTCDQALLNIFSSSAR